MQRAQVVQQQTCWHMDTRSATILRNIETYIAPRSTSYVRVSYPLPHLVQSEVIMGLLGREENLLIPPFGT